MSLSAMVKAVKTAAAAKGNIENIGPEQIAEMLAALGASIRIFSVDDDQKPGAFQGLAQTSLSKGAKVFVVQSVRANGEHLDAIFVMSSPQESVLSLVPAPNG